MENRRMLGDRTVTFEAILNIAGFVSFVAAVVCAGLSRLEYRPIDRSASALSCILFALASSAYFIAGAL